MKKQFFLSAIFSMIILGSYSQVAINTDATPPDASAMLDVKSTAKGLLIPRMTAANRTTISSPATSLLVYQTDGTAGYYMYNGSTWILLGGSNLSGSGSSGQVTYWSGTGSLSGTSSFYWDNTNSRLGIGLTSPAQQLEITGSLRMPATTSSTTGVIYKGAIPFLHNFAPPGASGDNLFLGESSGNFTMSGTSTSSSYNVGIGYQSLSQLTTGHTNAAVGYQSLALLTTGYFNAALGARTLGNNTSGGFNTAIGSDALQGNTIGGYNTALGGGSLSLNSTAGSNTSIGANALFTQSYNNSGTGWSSYNVAVGYIALYNNQPTSTTTGIGNTAIGAISMNNNTSGYNNTSIGYNSDVSAGNLFNTTAVGYNTIATASNQVRLGDANITSLFCKGANAATSSASPNLVTDATGQIMRSTASVPTGTGTASRVAFWNSSSSLGSNADLYWDDGNSRLGIGLTSPNQQLELTGSIRVPATTSSTTGVIYKGTTPFLHNFAPASAVGYNVFLGENAGNFTMSGTGSNSSYNIGIGYQALSGLTTGHDNAAMGYQSLKNTTTGSLNTALGSLASGSNTIANFNTAIGEGALYSNTAGGSNTAIGSAALYTQSYNNGGTAWDTHNVAIGDFALYVNQPTASTNGYKNTAIGSYSLNTNTTGYNNTAVGYSSENTNTTGYNNTAVGFGSDVGSAALYNTTSLGYNATATASNQVRLGDANITSLYCQGAYAATTTDAPNMNVNSSGQIMKSTVTLLSGTGMASKIAFWNGASTLDYNTNLHWDDVNSRLGIGTASPNQQLELTGNLRLPVTTATTGIIYAGTLPFIHNFGSNNNFMGANCGNLTLSGAASNSAIGDSALMNITSGDMNIAIGEAAMKSVTTSTGNIAIGYRAGRSIGTGSIYNTIIGYQSGMLNNTDRNTFLGCETGYSNTTGHYNVFVGHQAGFSSTTGNNSVAVGYDALRSQTGNATDNDLNNTAVGYLALYTNNPTTSNDGRGNVAVGSTALQNNTTGSFNTSVGYETMNLNTTGTFNTSVGFNALSSNTLGNTNTALGTGSLHRNTTSCVNTAIGDDALAQQSFTNSGATYSSYNVAIGYQALTNNQPTSTTNGYQNTAVGTDALFSNNTGSGNTAIGYNADVYSGNLTNTIAIGRYAFADASNEVVLGDDNITSFYCMGAYVGTVGTTRVDLYADNTGKIGYIASSARYKENILNMENVDWLYRLRPVNFSYKSDEQKKMQYGLIAEEVEKINPAFVSYNKDGQVETVSYSQLISPMIKALQEQQKSISTLQSQVDELKKDREVLMSRLEALEVAQQGLTRK
jgi:hypothetical protein